ncbi:MAG: hypothetical protein FWC27_11555 [Firmicutes bacterium]|nr:hypothetical protein [Bacillota bacterium]
MRRTKRILSAVLAAALLCAAAAPAAQAQGDLIAADVSGYLNMELGGGWHALYFDEETNPAKAFEPASMAGVFSQQTIDQALGALKKLNFDAAVTTLIDALRAFVWPVRMDENGESVAKNISADGNMYKAIQGDTVRFGWDWRLSPIRNAARLNDYIQWLRAQRPGDPALEKINFHGMSGSGPVLMAYLAEYGLKDVGSLWVDITMHNGTSMFGEIAKRKIMLNVEAIAKSDAIGFNELINYDISFLQPLLRILYESGLLDATERTAKLFLNPLIDRIDKEVVTPMFFMMPHLWSYVPAKDFAAAKKAQLGGDPRYAKLVKQIDDYHTKVQLRVDELLLDAAQHVKVGVWAGYGLPLLPLGANAAVQGDFQVDTAYASLGAAAAPYGSAFPSCYEQAQGGCGHDHISPDRLIDASACLLPEQTWFALGKPHSPEYSYSGWYEWFLETPNPTVHSSAEYPQFVKTVTVAKSGANGYKGEYVPLVVQPKEETLLDKLKAALLWILEHWRRLIRLAFFWVR